MIDVVVAGGGPVGLASALLAHRVGLSVVVLEPREGVIDKACGEGLMPGAVAALADLGVDPLGWPLQGIRYVDGSTSAAADFRAGLGRGVRRTTLHAALRERAAAAGIPLRPVGVTDVRQDDEGVTVDGLRGRYLLAADGLHSPVRRLVGLDRPIGHSRRFGLRRHVRMAPWTSYVEVHWADGVEAYVTPVAAELVGIALLSERRMPFDDQLATIPALRERLEGLDATKVRGAGPLRQRSRRRVAGRVLLVGDASGYVDALTGEGIALGIAQARAAVRSIRLGQPWAYELAWERITWRYRLMTSALVSATRIPTVRGSIVPASARLPRVFASAVNALARPA
jgi:flavin-dependent dehydrogenase